MSHTDPPPQRMEGQTRLEAHNHHIIITGPVTTPVFVPVAPPQTGGSCADFHVASLTAARMHVLHTGRVSDKTEEDETFMGDLHDHPVEHADIGWVPGQDDT